MAGFHRGSLALNTAHQHACAGHTGSPGHVARAHLTSPSVPGRACPPLTVVFSSLRESSSVPKISSHSGVGCGGKGNAPSVPSATDSVSPLGSEPAQERNPVSPAPVLGSTRCPRASTRCLMVWGHRERSCAEPSLWSSVPRVPTKLPQELQILSVLSREHGHPRLSQLQALIDHTQLHQGAQKAMSLPFTLSALFSRHQGK